MTRKKKVGASSAVNNSGKKPKGSYISQQDVPSYSLERALDIPKAIVDNYAGKPTKPLRVAEALAISPTGNAFRMLTGAAIAYGLTKGGYNAEEISVEKVAIRILRPKSEGDDTAAKREALLKPKVVSAFLEKYNGSSLPKESIAINVLEDMNVPRDRVGDVLALILSGAKSVGFIRKIKEKQYIDLKQPVVESDPPVKEDLDDGETEPKIEDENIPPKTDTQKDSSEIEKRKKRVFIAHGKNKALLEPLKKLLKYGELEAVVSIEKQSVSISITEKVLSDMRSCGGAIIHVDDEQRLIDGEAEEQIVLNPNVLIEIGGSMALYGKRFILLVKVQTAE